MAHLRTLEDLSTNDALSTSMGTSTSKSKCFPPSENPDGLRRGEWVQRPTWKVIQVQLDAIPITMEMPKEQTPPPIPHVHLLLCLTHTQEHNGLGLACSYKGTTSSVPDQPNVQSYIPEYAHPKPHKVTRMIEEIIAPYPDLSSFLFDHYFWVTGTSKSRNNQDTLQALITHPDFKPTNIKGINFRWIEEQLQGCYLHGNWEQRWGWRTCEISVGVPMGIKKTASVKRDNAAREARMQCAPCPPPLSKANIDGFLLSVETFHHCPICEVIRETFSQDPAT